MALMQGFDARRFWTHDSLPNAAQALYEAESATFRRFQHLRKVFRYAQYQWYRIAEASFSNFMAGQQLPFK